LKNRSIKAMYVLRTFRSFNFQFFAMPYERRITLLAILACLPSVAAMLLLLPLIDVRLRFKVTIAAAVLFATVASLRYLRQRLAYSLLTLSNIAAGIRENEFSLRARAGEGDDAMTTLARELNLLTQAMRERRVDELEAAALVRAIVAEIDAAIFAFGGDGRVQLVNPAGARLLGLEREQILGRTREELGLDAMLESQNRLAVRRGSFREKGAEHELLVVSDVSRELRAEELLAWQRLVRVLTHELNNSLAPIKAIASSLEQTIAANVDPAEWSDDARRGFGIISSRAEALTRFTQAYARVARLPAPQLAPVALGTIVARVAGLAPRVSIETGPELVLQADADQLEQALINIVQNAVDATEETSGRVTVTWERRNGFADVVVRDEGPGVASGANLFVPFFTTKAGGTGIGLVLSRQIAEAHGGSLAVVNREDRAGAEARLTLPL
jgi:two-component system, NtrC family, nitrogen regulation sensor histidine kinase NtrY